MAIPYRVDDNPPLILMVLDRLSRMDRSATRGTLLDIDHYGQSVV